MRTLFCVFSGTGNTLKVSEKLCELLTTLGEETKLIKMDKDTKVSLVDVDKLIISYPIHAFNAPANVIGFIKRLEKGNIPVYIVCSSGEPLRLNDAAVLKPRRILKKKGYDVLGEFSYVMPYNIIFRHSDEMAARMWQAAQKRAERDALKIFGGERNRKRVNVVKRVSAYVLKIEHIAMPIVGRHFKATDNCIGCGLCVQNCQQKNITIKDGKPSFGKNCIGCMGCAFICPVNAVKTAVFNGWKVNGKYSFDATPATDEQVCAYCHKSYLRYFHESESNKDA